MRAIRALAPALLLALAGLGVTAAAAQAPLQLPPPGAASSDAAAPKAKPARKSTHARTKRAPAKDQDALGLPGFEDTATRRGSATATERPRKFVPEEFDNDGSSGGGPRPFMSPSGRAGVGMQF
jgi:hypothetical protein